VNDHLRAWKLDASNRDRRRANRIMFPRSMNRSSLRRLLLVVLVAVLPGCGHDSVSPPAADTRIIAFSSGDDINGGSAIFLMHADGTNQVQITTSGAHDKWPNWSPDGTMIAFETDRLGAWPVSWAMNADGSNAHVLVHGYGAHWSPDGTKLLYSGFAPEGIPAVYIANADGSSPVRLTANPTGDLRAAWSPDGKQIVFSAFPSGPDGNVALFIVQADGTGQRRLTYTSGSSDYAAWSPDGSQIAFEYHAENAPQAIHIIRVDGTNEQALTPIGCGSPSWSPDGDQIAYNCSFDRSPLQIYVMNADGSDKRIIGTPRRYGSGPSWKPVR
jgi:Periplasmic component of the Tol biopolymer transport system